MSHAMATRSKHRGPFLSLPNKVQKTPSPLKYECVICQRKFRSRGWVKTHFRTHRTIPYNAGQSQYLHPYTHPSCWPATEEFSWERQGELLANKKHRIQVNASQEEEEDVMVEYGALDRKELAVKKVLKTVVMWWWWWNAQGRDITDALESAPPGRLDISGPASSERVPLLSTVIPASADVLLRAANDGPNSRIGSIARDISYQDSDLLSAATRFDADEYFPRDRGNGHGRLWTELDLSGHKPLTIRTVQQFTSTCTIDFLKANGENFDSHTIIGQAAMAFVDRLTPTSHRRATLQSYLGRRVEDGNYDRSKDREILRGAVVKAAREIFAGRIELPRRSADERATTWAMRDYADALSDQQAGDKIWLYRVGTNDALDATYDLRFEAMKHRRLDRNGCRVFESV